MSNRPCGMGKRILAALIDALCVILVCVAINAIINVTPLGEKMNKIVDDFVSLHNSYILSFNLGSMVDGSVVTHSNYTSSQVAAFNAATSADGVYQSLIKSYYNYYLWVNLAVVFVSELIFLFLIPFFSKYNQTIGKLLLKIGVVSEPYEMPLTNKSKIFRFLAGFVIETALIMFMFKGQSVNIAAIFSILITMTFIMMSQKRQALHDTLAKSKVVDLTRAILFNTIEEKEAYDAEVRAKKEKEKENNNEVTNEVIEAEIVETGEYIATLVELGSNRNDNAALLAEYQGISKDEALELLNELPVVILDNITKEKALKIQDKFDSLGSKVVVEVDEFLKEETVEVNYSNALYITSYSKENLKELILLLQDVTHQNIQDSQTMLKTLPCLVAHDLPLEEINAIKEKLEALNVNCEIK